jgi:hypothetical protein
VPTAGPDLAPEQRTPPAHPAEPDQQVRNGLGQHPAVAVPVGWLDRGPAVVKDQNERRIASDPDLDAGPDVAISAGLAAAMDSGELAEQPVEPLAHLLVGAFMQAAMVVARRRPPRRDRVDGRLDAPSPRRAQTLGVPRG